MTCSHCAETVRRTLAECEGVDSAEVDLEHGRAIVTGERPDPQRLAAAVGEAGFSAKAAS
jgi:copper chaperone